MCNVYPCCQTEGYMEITLGPGLMKRKRQCRVYQISERTHTHTHTQWWKWWSCEGCGGSSLLFLFFFFQSCCCVTSIKWLNSFTAAVWHRCCYLVGLILTSWTIMSICFSACCILNLDLRPELCRQSINLVPFFDFPLFWSPAATFHCSDPEPFSHALICANTPRFFLFVCVCVNN